MIIILFKILYLRKTSCSLDPIKIMEIYILDMPIDE